MTQDKKTPYDEILSQFGSQNALDKATGSLLDFIAQLYNGLIERGLPLNSALMITIFQLQQMYIMAGGKQS